VQFIKGRDFFRVLIFYLPREFKEFFSITNLEAVLFVANPFDGKNFKYSIIYIGVRTDLATDWKHNR
jgi:hypothetical protein